MKRKNILKKALCILSAAAMLMTVVPDSSTYISAEAAATSLSNPVIADDPGNTAVNQSTGELVLKSTTWDCVYYGSYPQKEVIADEASYTANNTVGSVYYDSTHDVVIDADLYNKLQNATDWDSLNDTVIDGTKYHRMLQSDATNVVNNESSSSYDAKFYKWADSTTYHYFKYEPIKWRVLETAGGKALLMADEAIDVQVYNTENVATTWETSYLRSYLNNDFIERALSSSEAAALQSTNLTNENGQGWYRSDADGETAVSYNTPGGNNTTDKVFVISAKEFRNEAFGFLGAGFFDPNNTYNLRGAIGAYDATKQSTSSTYAKALGIYSEISETCGLGLCYYWLRTPGRASNWATHCCRCGAEVPRGATVTTPSRGIRPCVVISLSDTSIWSYAGKLSTATNSGSATEKETEKATEAETESTHTHTPAAAVKENVVAATCTQNGSYDSVVYCSVCKAEISRTKVTTDKTSHTPAAAVKENVVAATCTQNGSYDSVVYCSVCKTEISRKTVTTDKLEHNYVNNKCTKCGAYEKLSTPALVSANNSASGIVVKWNAVSNAKYYQVYRKKAGGSWSPLAVVNTTSYTDTSAVSGTTYVYTVRCLAASDQKTLISSYVKAGISTIRLTEAKTSVSNAVGGVKVSWPKISGASGYIIYRKSSTSNWSILTTIANASATSYTDKSAVSGTSYTYTVRAYNGNTKSSYTGVSIKYLSAITKANLTLSNGTDGISVKWSKVNGASAYWLYRKTGSGAYKKIAVLTSNTYNDTSAVNGETYTYAVRAVSGTVLGNYEGKTIAGLALVSLKNVTTPAAKQIKVTWNKNSKCSGYQIIYSTSSTFAAGSSKTVTVAGQKTSNTIKGLTSKTKYYVSVRAYKTVNGVTYYSKWSAPKTVTVK